MPVRSKRLAGPVVVTPVAAGIYTVPAGETALLKDWSLTNFGGVALQVAFYRNGVANGNCIAAITVAAGSGSQQQRFVVMQAGEVLVAVVAAAVGNITVSISGAELEGQAD